LSRKAVEATQNALWHVSYCMICNLLNEAELTNRCRCVLCSDMTLWW